MASNDYLKLCEEAQKKKLKLMKKQEKQIKEIYNDMYLNVSKKLSKVNPNTLSERYLQELKKVLEKEIKESSKQVKEVIKDNIEKSSKLANDTQLDFFMSINNKYNLNMEDTFSSMFSKIPKEAMNEILFGKVYKDRAGLSERIWLDTKKFNKDINYVIAEGIANKKPTYEIAKDLEKYVNPKAAKEWEWSKVYPNANKVVDYNAQRLARTSIQHAFQQAQKRSCKKNPYIEYIKWLSSNTSRTCELCNSRDGQLYKVNDVPLDHPNGLCTTIPQIEKSLDEIGEELRSWIDGEANPMLDKWFKKHGEEFIPKSDKKEADKKVIKAKEKVDNKKTNKKEVSYKEYSGNKLSKSQSEWFNSLTKKEKSDLNEYTTSIYQAINTGLRKGTIEEYDKRLANSISGALQRNKFDIDIQVYRGSSASIFKNILDSNTFELMKNRKIDAEILKGKLIGNTINDKGFMSTTCDSNMMDFLNGVLFKIDIDRGMNGLGYIAPLSDFKDEEEVLLDKNTSLYIKDVSFNKEMNSYIISCKYLGQI